MKPATNRSARRIILDALATGPKTGGQLGFFYLNGTPYTRPGRRDELLAGMEARGLIVAERTTSKWTRRPTPTYRLAPTERSERP